MVSIDLIPQLTKAKITELNETAVKVSIKGRLGVITVPLRWIITEKALAVGQEVEFYFSYMKAGL
ncbi:CBO2463/CBO2479 domain-containing protein [Anaerocolumna sp. MB42-C2]|uniref:CBO2463/CBO2479 domain-containing protein n=1 Tax=Anaerocolumna sp. MB42-C2 TaxID=3070997 RepID=UPI0027DF8834|nr:CBO2463/CBO2479 domain-containing protein [Anaerocolumna sp. MB42-C2]WMJ88188.1 CBO2463/CBO2479 domain-containing protein [Anaerocolumna sp. MB42-C2]